MKQLRPFRREALLFLALSLLVSAGAALCAPSAGLICLGGTLVLSWLHLHFSARRNRELTELSAQLHRILQGAQELRLEEYSEGEQSILRCELQKLLQQLSAAEQASEDERRRLSAALADISHQLRTPMTSMELICAMLERPELPAQKRQELARRLSGLIMRMSWLIEALLKLSRLDAGVIRFQTQTLPLRELIERSAQPLDVAMELRDQRLTLKLPAGECPVCCDPAWTAEALGNLLKNASEHCPAGGEIRVGAVRTALYTEITVHDDGPGFDPEELPHLFERFYRGRQAAKGSFGIGLALARRIVSEQGGTLKAANHANGGAIFTLRLYRGTV